MRLFSIPLCLAALSALAQAPPVFSWGPSVYSLRATNKTGGALILLDEKGQETIIDRDERTAGGGGLFSTVLYHATFYGAFSATPDLKTVVFTRHGKPKAPFSFSLGASSGNTGGGFGYSAAFGEHDLEGIFLWDRATGKSTRLWDQDSLLAQLKAWVKTPEGAAFANVDLKDEIRAHRPTTMYHMAGGRFIWVTGASAVDLDVTSKTARILFSDMDKGRVAGGGPATRTLGAGSGTLPGSFSGTAFTVGFSEKPALTAARQNADGSLTLVRPGLVATIPVEGPVRISGTGQGHRILWNGPNSLLLSNGEVIKFLDIHDPAPDVATSIKIDNSLVQPAADGRSIFVYKHYKMKADTVSRVSPEGKVLWTSPLGDCRFGFLLGEDQNQVHVLVRRTAGEIPFKVVLKADTGAILNQDAWLPGEAFEKAQGGYPAPVELADRAVMMPSRDGFLVWAPSRGEVEGAPTGGWSMDGSGLTQIGADKALDGQWCLVTPQLLLKPLARRPLADQVIILAQGRMQPVTNWINQGIGQSSNPGDRLVRTLNKQPVPLFTRDFGFWLAPALTDFSLRVAPGGSAPVSTAP